MQDLSGSTLGGRYLLRRRLGAGGMGVVYEAWQGDLGRTVAVKLIGSLDDETLARFQREARALASLGHPHIVQVYDFQARGGEPPFLVMELLNGESLADCIKRERRLAPARVARIGAHVASALSVAHRAGIVHRDIKPANVFLVSTPTLGEVSKVLDFGIAKVEGSEGGLTQTGHVIGTLSYMSPEQAAGAPLDGRSDIYSLSACLFVALTGQKPPFPGFDLASPAPAGAPGHRSEARRARAEGTRAESRGALRERRRARRALGCLRRKPARRRHRAGFGGLGGDPRDRSGSRGRSDVDPPRHTQRRCEAPLDTLAPRCRGRAGARCRRRCGARAVRVLVLESRRRAAACHCFGWRRRRSAACRSAAGSGSVADRVGEWRHRGATPRELAGESCRFGQGFEREGTRCEL